MYTANVNVRRSARNVTNNYMLVIPFADRDRCKKSCITLCSKMWNCLSNEIIELDFEHFGVRVRKNDIYHGKRASAHLR